MGHNKSKKSRFLINFVSLLIFIWIVNAFAFQSAMNNNDGQALRDVKWVEYRDPRYDFRLAVPNHWTMFPTSLSDRAAAIFMNYKAEQLSGEKWPDGAAKIQIDVYENESISLEQWISEQRQIRSAKIVDLQIDQRKPIKAKVVFVSKEYGEQTLHVFSMPPDNILVMSVLPQSGWNHRDVQIILKSLVFSKMDNIQLPTEAPVPLISTQKFKSQYTSPSQQSVASTLAQAKNSPIPLWMPFKPGTTWQVGGVGYFYGEGTHSNANNDYYATDWNKYGADDYGEPVYPVANGTVILAKQQDYGYGYHVVVQHDADITTLYGHLSKISVSENDYVTIETKLGELGSTGNSTGPHLHMSFRHDNSSKSSDSDPRLPSPMIARNGTDLELWDLADGSVRTVSSKEFFSDVSKESWAKKWIDAVYAWGIMGMCNASAPPQFCPNAPITRGEAAKYWVTAAENDPDYVPDPGNYQGIFDDVPADHPYAGYIEQLYNEGKVVGCSIDPPLYCPDRDITRVEMAVFILRAMFGTDYEPPLPTGIFVDMPKTGGPDEHWGIEWAEDLYKKGISSGCCESPLKFCPERPVTRDQMAVFILRSFDKYPDVYDGAGGGGAEDPATWLASITLTDNGQKSATLVFGQAPTATNGLDVAFDETELPPSPPSGSFDARFELPGSAGVGALRDFRPKSSDSTTWSLKFQPGAGGYPITFNWDPAKLLEGEFYLTDAITGSLIRVNMKTQSSYTLSNSGFSTLFIKKSNLVIADITTVAGWNMISVP